MKQPQLYLLKSPRVGVLGFIYASTFWWTDDNVPLTKSPLNLSNDEHVKMSARLYEQVILLLHDRLDCFNSTTG